MLHARIILLVVLAKLLVTLTACDERGDEETAAQDEREIMDIIHRLESPLAVYDDATATALRDDIEALSEREQTALVRKIDELYPTEPGEFHVAVDIPVSWSSGPIGILPSEVGTTTRCGGDTDVRVVFSAVPNAHDDPYSLQLTTNNLYVMGVMSAHRFKARAYEITPWNTVNLCIGTRGLVGPAVLDMFANGLWIR